MGEEDNKSVLGINSVLNSLDSHPNSKDIVPPKDIEKIVEAGFELYSWGSNPLNFVKEEKSPELYFGAEIGGYSLQIQTLSDTPIPHRYNEELTKEFFKKRNVEFKARGRLHTENMNLTKALGLFFEFESEYDNLIWTD